MKKRLLSALLAVCMMLSAVPMLLAASAEGETVVASGDVNEEVKWELTGTPINAETGEGGYTLTISSKETDPEFAAGTISKKAGINDPDPNTWNAIRDIDNENAYKTAKADDDQWYTDTPWGNAQAGYANHIKTLVVKEGITAVALLAFSHLRALENVTLPSTVSYMGYKVFAGDTSLKRIVLPEGLARINQSTFEGCTSLSYVSIPTTLDLFAHRWCSNDISGQNVSNNMFKDCTSLKAIYLHNVRADESVCGKKPLDCLPFAGLEDQITILCPSDSYAKTYAESAFKTDGTTAKPTIKVEVVDDKAAYAAGLPNPVSVSAFGYYIGENAEDTKTGIRAMITVDENVVAKLEALGWLVECGYVAAPATAATAATMTDLLAKEGAISAAAYADYSKLLTYTGGTAPINVKGKHVFTAELMNVDEAASYILTGYWKTVSPDGATTACVQANDGTVTKFTVGESAYIGISAEKLQGMIGEQSVKKNS